MEYTNSPLVCKKQLSDKHNDRKYPISKITIHHAAGVMTFERLLNYVATCDRDMSANYVLRQGKLGLVVEEKYRAWTSSNAENDHRAVTIEVGNSSAGGQWPIADEDLALLIKWCADVCKRNNIPKLYYDGTPNGSLTIHSMFAATSCLPIDRTELLTPNGWVSLGDIKIGDPVATVHIDNLGIKFSNVLDIVPEKLQDTYLTRDFEATSDHRVMYFNQPGRQYVGYYRDLYNQQGSIYIPNAGYYSGVGLPLSNAELEFLIAVQADGCYMRDDNCVFGVEFHIKKDRKIQRIKSVLEQLSFEYNICNQSDGTTKIRVYGKSFVHYCEDYLSDKRFTWDWINLSPQQAAFFLETIMYYDGCVENQGYSSSIVENVNIVQAIAALNGVGSKLADDGTRVYLKKAKRSLGANKLKRKPKQRVSCVTVESGFILIRQYGRTTVTGNCPGPYIKSKLDYICQEVNKLITNEIPKEQVSHTTETYDVVTQLYGYMTAADAINDVNRKRTVKVGKYYVFNKTDSAVNVTAKAGVPGAWICKAKNTVAKPAQTAKVVTLESIAREVINGEWGNGTARTKSLTAAGYNATNVQKAVNAILAGKSIPTLSLYTTEATTPRKSINTIAREVLQGKWGNGVARKQKLEAAGYNYAQVQAAVNKLL